MTSLEPAGFDDVEEASFREIPAQNSPEEREQLLDKLRSDAEHRLSEYRVYHYRPELSYILKSCNQAITIDPKDATFYIIKADVLTFARRFHEALEAYDKAIILGQNPLATYNINAYALVQKAMIMHKLDHIDEARAIFEEAAALDPNPYLYFDVGRYSTRTSPEPSREEFERYKDRLEEDRRAKELEQFYRR